MKALKYYILTFLIISSLHSISQVIYNELNPTIKIPSNNGGFKIDFNSDNIYDVIIRYGGYKSNPGWPATIYQMIGFDAGSDSIVIIMNSERSLAFNNLDVIQYNKYNICMYRTWTNVTPCTNFVTSTYYGSGDPGYSGLVSSITDKYFVVKFKINNNYHYGWIKFSKSYGMNVEIKSFAYNSSPDMTFIINDPLATSVQELNISNEIKVYPNPFNSEVKISSKEGVINNISLFDIVGNLVYSNANNKSNELKINTTSLPKGIYLVKMNAGGKQISKYIVK